MKRRAVSLATLVAMLMSVALVGILPSYAEGKKYATPIRDDWYSESVVDPEDYDYTFAFVGDIQSITEKDYLTGKDSSPNNDTHYVDNLFEWIVDNKDAKKIDHVFTLGDLTEYSAQNNTDLMYAASDPVNNASGVAEFEIVKNAVKKLDGVVPYTIVRGNHDDYLIDDYFSEESYTSQFDGFYDGSLEPGSDANANYWADKYYKNGSITNSYRLAQYGDKNFIFITLDFNPTRGVITWLDNLLTQYSSYNAVIITHAYLTWVDGGRPMTPIDISDSIVKNKNNGMSPRYIWNNCLSKHENVVMTVSGHVSVNDTFTYETVGDNGNKVVNVLVDPQSYDKNIQPTGMVFLMHFKNGESTVTVEYVSTNLNLYKKGNTYTLSLELVEQEYIPNVDSSVTTTTTTTVATTIAVATAAPTLQKGCKGSIIGGGAALIGSIALLGAAAVTKRKKIR